MLLVAFALMLLLAAAPTPAHAWFDDVATESPAQQDLGTIDAPIYPQDIPEGQVFRVIARTSSRMCIFYENATDCANRTNREQCLIQRQGDTILVAFYMSQAYTHIYYPGTAEEAASLTNAEGTDASAYTAGQPDSGYVPHLFNITVPALNYPITMATFSGGNKETIETALWYTRDVVIKPTQDLLDAIEAYKSPPEPEPQPEPEPEPEPQPEPQPDDQNGQDEDAVDPNQDGQDDGSQNGEDQGQDGQADNQQSGGSGDSAPAADFTVPDADSGSGEIIEDEQSGVAAAPVPVPAGSQGAASGQASNDAESGAGEGGDGAEGEEESDGEEESGSSESADESGPAETASEKAVKHGVRMSIAGFEFPETDEANQIELEEAQQMRGLGPIQIIGLRTLGVLIAGALWRSLSFAYGVGALGKPAAPSNPV